jgi:hypothetical protein
MTYQTIARCGHCRRRAAILATDHRNRKMCQTCALAYAATLPAELEPAGDGRWVYATCIIILVGLILAGVLLV